MVIRFFSQSETHREFSNFAPFPFDLDGQRWATSEHYYQAQKFTDRELQTKIRKAEKPIIAKNLADKHRDRIRPDWDAVKDEVMYRAVRRKFELHSTLRSCCSRPATSRSSKPPRTTTIGARAAKAPARTSSARSSSASAPSCATVNSWARPDHVARDRADHVSRHVSRDRSATASPAGRWRRGLWSLDAQRHPRARDRPASLGGRHAGRRRPRHGDARRRARARHRRGGAGRRHPAAPAHEPARPAADPGASRDAGAGRRRGDRLRPVRGDRPAPDRGTQRSRRCRSATMCCRAANSPPWC